MATKKRKTATAQRRTTVVSVAAKRRRKKRRDPAELVLAGAGGYVAPDIMPTLPFFGKWLAEHPQVSPALVSAGVAFIGGKLAGGQWAELGRYAALGSIAQYLLRRAAEKPAPAGIAGSREILDEIGASEPMRALPPISSDADIGVVRRIGDVLR